MSLNSASAERSVPLLAELEPAHGVTSEFSPSPEETLRLIERNYKQANTLLVRFKSDQLDQSPRLLQVLQQRSRDHSQLIERAGDHLTPASAGLRQNLLGGWADDPARQRELDQLAEQLLQWWKGLTQTRN